MASRQVPTLTWSVCSARYMHLPDTRRDGTLGKGGKHERWGVEVGRLDELDLGMAFGDQVRVRGAWRTST